MHLVNTYEIGALDLGAAAVRNPVEADDGGDGFWRVTYDVASKTFSDFNMNSEA